MWLRAAVVTSFVASVFLACGGRTEGLGGSSSGGSSGGGSSGASSGASSGGSGSSGSGSSGSGSSGSGGGSGGGSSSGFSSSSSGGVVSCVFIDPNTYDRSCNTGSDCTYVTTGEVCTGYCVGCGSTLINQDGLARYEKAVAPIQGGECGCGVAAPPSCVDHTCSVEGPDGGPPSDAGQCVDILISTFDQSCNVASDCMLVRGGEVCSGECDCGGTSPINVGAYPAYQNDLTGVVLEACPCPPPPPVVCMGGTCAVELPSGRVHEGP
jgi:hypothetical protein